jgi:hypothetical protein
MVKWRLRNTLQSSFHIGSGSGGRALEKDDEIKRFGAKHRIGGGDDWRFAIGRLVRVGGVGGRRGLRAAVPRSRRPAPRADMVEFASNWYVRGDLAYAQKTFPNISPFTFGSSPSVLNTYSADVGGTTIGSGRI